MNRTTIFLAFLLSLIIVPCLTYSTEKFHLKYEETKVKDNPLLNLGYMYSQILNEKPVEPKGIPKNASKNLKYLCMNIASRNILFAVDTADSNQTLYADTDMDGDLSDEKALTIKEAKKGLLLFEDIHLKIPDGQNRTEIVVSATVYDGFAYFMPVLTGYYKGKISLGEKVIDFAVADSNLDGKYNSYLQSIATDSCDNVWMDFDKDGSFGTQGVNNEIMPLCRILHVDNEYYSIAPAPNGKSVKVEKANPKLGTLDVQNPDVNLTLISDTGLYNLSGSEGKWKLPVGAYSARLMTLTKKDEKGITWKIALAGAAGELSSFNISENEAMVVKLGAPLTIKTEVSMTAEAAIIGMSLAGQNGEEYSARISRDEKAQPAPKFRIVNREGKEILKDSFNYG